ncbi:hypothetical protein KJA16_01820 [Patescibacteria group bacterium]|nr:hypothetical protein [Patescibacteria group bacterium]
MKKVLTISLILLSFLVLGGFFSCKYFFISEKKIILPEKENSQLSEISPQAEKEETIEDEKIIEEKDPVSRGEELIKEAKELISKTEKFIEEKEKEKILAIEKARERSENVKGIYMTEFIANSQNPAAIKIQEDIKKLLFETELNALVIDVKEAYGPNLPNSLKKLIEEFKKKDVWVIARICAFRDSSLIDEKPELYLKTKKGDFWKDYGGGYWLDPQSPEVWQYIIKFSQEVIDFDFDELQFDYIRFPSDGNLEDIVFPFYDEKQEKQEAVREFLLNLSRELKSYQPKIILSVDLFGLVATQYGAPGVGQRLEDVADLFDYISFMLYPSHFYGGFEVKEDLKRGLPGLYFPYISEDVSRVVSNHPYEVVFRSILSAKDYLLELNSEVKIRPWLQDFSLRADSERGIYYDSEKVKAQVRAAEDSGASGWLLWNPTNIYSQELFKK